MYHFKEVMFAGGEKERKVLVISFDEPCKQILEEFLMADASMLNYSVLDQIEKVLTGEVEKVETSGNRCSLLIKKEVCYLEDLLEGMFDDFDTYPALEIPTREFRDLIVMWQGKQAAFNQANKIK